MPALNYTPEIGATIRGARLVGTPLRTCARAAGVPWSTCCDWLAKGRAYNEAAPADRIARHAALGQFAAEIDKAGAQAEARMAGKGADAARVAVEMANLVAAMEELSDDAEED